MESFEEKTPNENTISRWIFSLSQLIDIIDESGKYVDLNREVMMSLNGKITKIKMYDGLKQLNDALKVVVDDINDEVAQDAARKLLITSGIYLSTYRPNENGKNI